MEKNEGKADRIIRLLIGGLSVYMAWNYSAWWYILAAIALITAFTGSCRLYTILGISTIKSDVKKAKPKKKKF